MDDDTTPAADPLPPLDETELVGHARGIVTGQLLVADLRDEDWRASLSLILTAWGRGEPPPNVGAILVPVEAHQPMHWLNGHVPAVTITCYLVATESVPALNAVVEKMRKALYPEPDPD